MAKLKDTGWDLCIICPSETNEDLKCLCHNQIQVHQAFVKNVGEFQKID